MNVNAQSSKSKGLLKPLGLTECKAKSLSFSIWHSNFDLIPPWREALLFGIGLRR
jgi:hypothetical protein